MSLPVPARILILEDDSQLLEVLKFVLEGAGYKVAAASNGAEALNLIKAAGVDLVMLDVTMAGMSGLDVARELRAGEETAHVRIALHTGMKEAEILAEFSDYDTFMPKGDDADELLRLVAGVLNK